MEDKDNFIEFFHMVYNSYDKLTGVILDILIHIHK